MCFVPKRRANFHISSPTRNAGTLLEAEMLKKCTLLWCETYFQVKMLKHRNARALLEVEMLQKCTRCSAKHISKSKWLHIDCFSEPIFRPSGATNHWKTTVNRDFPTFSRICIFFLLTLSLLLSSLFWSFSSLISSLLIFLFSSLVFSSSVFSSHLFSSLLFSSLLWLFPPLLVNFVESLTSKFLSPARHTYTLMCIYLEAQRHIGSSCSARDAPNGEPVRSNVYMKDWSGNTSKVWKHHLQPFLMVDHCVADSVGRWRM